LGVLRMPWRRFFAILTVLNFFLGVPLVSAQDKSFYETFEKIGNLEPKSKF